MTGYVMRMLPLTSFFVFINCSMSCTARNNDTDSSTDSTTESDSSDTADTASDSQSDSSDTDEFSLVVGSTVELSPNSESSIDFHFYASESGWYHVSAKGNSGEYASPAPRVEIFNPEGELHVDMDDYPGNGGIGYLDSGTDFYVSRPGAWLVRVSSRYPDHQGYGSIRIDALSQFTKEPDSRDAPFISTTSPAPDYLTMVRSPLLIPVGVLLEEPGDVDWIRIPISYTHGVLAITGQERIPGSAATIQVTLFDPQQQQVAQVTDLGVDGRITHIVDADAAGDYLLRVEDVDGAGGPDHWSVIYIKTIDLDSELLQQFAVETEPNNSLSAAEIPFVHMDDDGGQITHDVYVRGTLDTSAAEDWFRFDMFVGAERYSLSWWGEEFGSAIRPSVQVFSGDGQLVFEFDGLSPARGTEEPRGGPFDEYFSPLPSTETCYVRIWSAQGIYGATSSYFVWFQAANWTDYND